MKGFKSDDIIFPLDNIATETLVILGKSVPWSSPVLYIEREHVMAPKNSSSHCEDFFSEVAITAAFTNVHFCME